MKRLLSKITVKGSSSPITILGVSVMLLLAFSPFITAPAQSVEEHVYYGVIPSRLYLYRPYRTTHGSVDISRGWYLNEGTVKTSGFIAIIGSEEKTHVKVYVMPEGEIVSEASLGLMEKHFVSLPNGTVFKVISDKPVTVLVFSGEPPQPDAFEGITPVTFYPSVDGGLRGKEIRLHGIAGLIGSALSYLRVRALRSHPSKSGWRGAETQARSKHS